MNAESDNFPNMNVFTEAWSDMMNQMMKSMPMTTDRPPADMTREIRSTMFKAWSDYCEQFMRSPDFLNIMKQSLSASIESRKQLNEFLAQAQHDFQSASRQDIDQLMASIQRMEQRMADHMDQVHSQLSTLQTRIDELEENKADEPQQKSGSKKGKKKDK